MNQISQSHDVIQHYLDAFYKLSLSKDAFEKERFEAIDRFENQGFPNNKQEAWRYTDIGQITEKTFVPLVQEKTHLKKNELQALVQPKLDSYELVFVDGFFTPGLSKIPTLPKLTILNLTEALKKHPQQMKKYFLKDHAKGYSAFNALSIAFMQQGIWIELEDNVQIDKPIHLISVTTDSAINKVFNTRNMIFLGKRTKATILQSHYYLTYHRYLNNTVTELYLKEDAKLQYYHIQQENMNSYHINHTNVYQKADSCFDSWVANLGGGLVYQHLHAVLDGKNTSANMRGLSILKGKQHIENHAHIDHVAEKTNGYQDYNSLVHQHAKNVFHGKVVVHKNAQKTVSEQSSRNLLLSPTAEVNTKPELQIYADDVKCAHGTTVGQLDESSLFYLRSRGLDEDAARALLTIGFTRKFTATIGPEKIREYLHQQCSEKLSFAK